MAHNKRTSPEVPKITSPRMRRVRSLAEGPDITIHYPRPDVAVVVNSKPGGGLKRPKIDICKCTKTEYKCRTTSDGNTICEELCVAWECTTI